MSVTILTILIGGVAAAFVAGRLSRAIKISEFRQAWINDLRKDTADFIGAAHRWFRKYDEIQDIHDNAEKIKAEREQFLPIHNEAMVILYRVRMRINPRADSPTKTQDDAFLKSLTYLVDPSKLDPSNRDASWFGLADKAVEEAREILKREWDVAKQPGKWI